MGPQRCSEGGGEGLRSAPQVCTGLGGQGRPGFLKMETPIHTESLQGVAGAFRQVRNEKTQVTLHLHELCGPGGATVPQ